MPKLQTYLASINFPANIDYLSPLGWEVEKLHVRNLLELEMNRRTILRLESEVCLQLGELSINPCDMREVKFRAFINGLMCYEGFHIAAPGYAWVWKDISCKDSETLEAPIMQFTGLKDKNGVEIYEGDVVKITHDEGISWNKTYIDNGVVEFSRGAFVVKCKNSQTLNAKDKSKRYFYLNFAPKREFEVIGNIYLTHTITN